MKGRVLLAFGALLLLFGVLGYHILFLHKAEFTNLTPARIRMDNRVYRMSEEILPADAVERRIGTVTKVVLLVSYTEDANPYKNPKRIYKVKGREIHEAIGVEVNNKIYRAESQEASSP